MARVALEDFPATTCTALTGGNWFDWLDAIGDDGQTCIAGLVHDLTSEEGDAEAMHVESPLIHGSLFWLRRLDVHPKLRGQEIGARLMPQALWTVRRVSGDLAVLEAFPTESLFDVAAPTRTASAVRRLVSYYERVGFRRSRPSERIRCAAVGMHVQFGTFGLPVLGLPGLSHFPRHLRVSYRGAGATRSTLERPQISGAASATPAY